MAVQRKRFVILSLSMMVAGCTKPTMVDAGMDFDAGRAADGGMELDSGREADSGSDPDAGMTDAGCAVGEIRCDGVCTNTMTSMAHCGACDMACTAVPMATSASCVDGDCVQQCPAGSYLTGDACTAIPAPRQIAPLSTAYSSSRRPRFRWELAAGTDGAVVEICEDRACTMVEQTLTVTGSSGAATSDLAPGVHYWRARGRVGAEAGLVSGPVWQVHVGRRTAAVVTSYGSFPDYNGDGIADLAVGATGASGTAGAVHVYYGRPTSTPLAPSPDITLSVAAVGANGAFGQNVRNAGDVNGDGFGDLAVGTGSAFGGQGRVYLFFGGPSGLASAFDVELTRPASGTAGGLGSGVSGPGDINGDGYADVLAGQGGNPGQPPHVHVFTGGPMGPSSSRSSTIVGPVSDGYFGYRITGGDMNGDEIADVLIGAHTEAGIGRAYFYLGSTSGLPAAPSRTLPNPIAANVGFTSGLTFAGDLNGDGYGDAAIGNPNENSGDVLIYYGGTTGLTASPSANIDAPSDGTSRGFGSTTAFAGDVNGDGVDDLFVGNYQYPDSSGTDRQGRAHLFYGSTGGISTTSAANLPNPDGFNANFGTTGGGADFNGDTVSDFAVGAFGSDLRGYVHIYLGSATTGLSTTMVGTGLNGPDGPGYYFATSIALLP